MTYIVIASPVINRSPFPFLDILLKSLVVTNKIQSLAHFRGVRSLQKSCSFEKYLRSAITFHQSRILESHAARSSSFINSTSSSTKWSFITFPRPIHQNDILQSKHVGRAANCLDRTHCSHFACRSRGTHERRDEEAICARTFLKSLTSKYNAGQEMG